MAGKDIATLGTGWTWPSEFSFNFIRRAKLLSYVMLASIDGFVGRIYNEHLTNTTQSSLVMWAFVDYSMLSAKLVYAFCKLESIGLY